NAGNVRTSRNRADIRIDVTKPTATVSYDNNVAYYDYFFNRDRVATIVVTERNFDPTLFNLALTNTAGAVPALSAWEKVTGTGNGDDTRWIAKLVFTHDGDYTFEFSFADAADNACSSISYGDSVRPNAFTMDQTRPVISVAFDNNDAQHENYYKKGRTATITVEEHNFDPNLITIVQSAVQDEQEMAVPTLSEWTTNKDTHTATLQYTDDAYYILTVDALDKANNTAESNISQAFFVDKVAPQIRITGIDADGAYNGDVLPAIECEDVNFDPLNVQIEITRSLDAELPFTANTVEIRHGIKTTYENVPAIEENDDIYTVKVTVTDMAGNQSVSEKTFSINRFGSTYSLDETVSSLLGTYISNPSDIVLKEVNPDELSDIRVTIFKNNETIVLNEDKDYTVSVGDAKGAWKEYTIKIKDSVFQDDGVYRVSVHSVDKAGNVSENTMETKDKAISFGVDKTLPRIVVTNVENGKTYPLDNLPVEMTVNDNLQLASVKVYLDGEDNLLKEWTEEEIRNMENSRSDFNFDISGESKQSHRLLVVAVDSAGNVQREEISGFYVT
ncbi:MAG: Ig-like domain repeat protein, partial [Lachnospiraceae bacterium]|nr:Ig-like domain repeat protein [Lachnospiraceae bacterium]